MPQYADKVATRYSFGPAGLLFMGITVLVLGAAIYTQANLLFWAFGLTLGGLIVSALWAWRSLKRVAVQRLAPSHGVAGEPLVLRYHLINRSWLPIFSLTVHESWGRGRQGWKKTGPIAADPPLLHGRPFGWVLHLGPNQKAQAEAQCYPQLRGALELERIVLGTSFPFSIIRKTVHFEQPGRLLIYPHLYRMNRRVISALSRAHASSRKHIDRRGGLDEFFGLRDYRPGDSLKLVDWKRTARTGRMVTREMTQPAPHQLMVLLDLATPAPANPANHQPSPGSASPQPMPFDRLSVERAISLAASLICDAYLHGYQVGLHVIGLSCQSLPPHHALPHRTLMLDALAGLDPSQPVEPAGSAPQASVIVWPGPGSGDPGRNGVAILGAEELNRYVVEADAESLLNRRGRPQT